MGAGYTKHLSYIIWKQRERKQNATPIIGRSLRAAARRIFGKVSHYYTLHGDTAISTAASLVLVKA